MTKEKNTDNFHENYEELLAENTNPCWVGYHMVGTKMKNGKKVPNCVPNESKKKVIESFSEFVKKQ